MKHRSFLKWAWARLRPKRAVEQEPVGWGTGEWFIVNETHPKAGDSLEHGTHDMPLSSFDAAVKRADPKRDVIVVQAATATAAG